METQNFIYGRTAVIEALRLPTTPGKLYLRNGINDAASKTILDLARSRGVPVMRVDSPAIDRLCGKVSHQGVVLVMAEVAYVSIEDMLAKVPDGTPPLIVMADGVTDPHNLGALIRCADGAGAHGVIISKHDGAGVTAAVIKTSAGAALSMPVARVSSMANAVEALKKKHGLWTYAVESGGQDYREADTKGAAAFVFGSEGEGVSRLVRERCDFTLSIPMRGQVNSLNVSCAAAVILYSRK